MPSELTSARLRQALTLVAESDVERRARIHNWLGRAYYALGRNPEAIGCFQELIRLTTATTDDLTRALPYQVLGKVYIFMGRFVLGREYLERAASLLREHPESDEDLSYVLGMLGSAYVYLGDFERAERLTRESIELGEKLGHQTRISQGPFYLGIVSVVQGDGRKLDESSIRRWKSLVASVTSLAPQLGPASSE